MFKKYIAIAAVLITASPAALAQSVNVLGSDPNAAQCYQYAKVENSSGSAILTCDEALGSGSLTRRDRAAVFVNRGILKRLDWQVQAAYEDYNKALKLIPDMPEAIGNRANIFFLADKYDRALSDYQKSLDLGISDEKAVRLNMAMTYAAMKRYGEADAAYNDVLARYPEWELARQVFGRYQNNRAQNGTDS